VTFLNNALLCEHLFNHFKATIEALDYINSCHPLTQAIYDLLMNLRPVLAHIPVVAMAAAVLWV